MLISESMRSSGHGLFRRRSFALAVLLPLLAVALARGELLESWLGQGWDDGFEMLCVAIVAAGLVMRAATVGFVPRRTSGRNTGGQVADVLNTTGLYSLTRNPLYLANSAIYLAVAATTQDPLLLVSVALFLVLYYERIVMAEEAFLLERFGPAYAAWAAEVPPFLPRLHGWRRPALPFSLRSVLRREPPSWLGAVVALAAVDLVADAIEGEWADLTGGGWLVAVAVALAVYLVLFCLRRFTRALQAAGR